MSKLGLYIFATIWNSIMISVVLGGVWLIGAALTGGNWGWIDGNWDKVWIIFILLNIVGWLKLAESESQ